MVEAIIVIPVFVIVLAGSIFLWRAYTQKEAAMADARMRLWAYAINDNCGDRGDASEPGPDVDTTSIGQAQGSSDALPSGADTSETSKVGDAPSSTLNRGVASASIDTTGTVTAPGLLGGATTTVRAHLTMICNEAPHDGDLGGLASSGLDLVKKAIGGW
jgi:hypothetical protein